MSLKQFLLGEKSPQYIKIKVIESHQEKSIVGDATSLAICCNPNKEFQNMKQGQCYQILKPTTINENEFIPNEKLKPIKINNFTVSPKKHDLAKLQTLISSHTEDKPSSIDKKPGRPTSFKDLETLPAQTEIKNITAKVIGLSKDISGAYGKYCIGKLKDIDGTKMDINIYNLKMKQKMDVGNIIELKKLKIM